MYLKCHRRVKDGKEHRYWSIVEKPRCADGRAVDRHLPYLGELNDSQQAAWLRCIEAFEEDSQRQLRLALFPADRAIPAHAADIGIQRRLSEFTLERPRQWGACWIVCQPWAELQLDQFWRDRLPDSREGTSWYHLLLVLVAYRLIAPGSEWRLHREWYHRSARGDLLHEDGPGEGQPLPLPRQAAHAQGGPLHLPHPALAGSVRGDLRSPALRPDDDLTSTYFESAPPFPEGDPRRHGYSRDHRPDCAPGGYPVKLLPQAGELYVYVQSAPRVAKERAMCRRRLKQFWARLHALQRQRPTYETLLLKLGAAKKEAGRAWALVQVELPAPPPKGERARRVDFSFRLDKAKLRRVRRREGRYLLRSNLTATDPARLWEYYLQLVEVEAAFKDLKGDLAIRPIFHRRPARIEAHLFVAFLAYCLHVTLKAHLRPHAPGLTVRQVLEKFAAIQMLDVHFPTTDGRELLFTRYTQPEPDQQLLLAQLGWTLPRQPPPRITAKRAVQM